MSNIGFGEEIEILENKSMHLIWHPVKAVICCKKINQSCTLTVALCTLSHFKSSHTSIPWKNNQHSNFEN